ncbi:MAG: hypothetical protein P4L28_04310 [Paludibacteraceae bacterium]|nr:hypothetical protein [Paludibacteraceae bacterium]
MNNCPTFESLSMTDKANWKISVILLFTAQLLDSSAENTNKIIYYIPIFEGNEIIGYLNPTKHNPTNIEFETLFKEKLKIHGGTKDLFISDEFNKIKSFPNWIRDEFTIINKWVRFLTEKLNTTNKEEPPHTKPKQLKTNLSNTQRGTLFELLKEGGFIPNDSDEDSFIWAFGGNGELEFEYKAIKWNYGNNALFELLEIVTETVSNENLRNCINLFINKKGKQITNREKISRPKKNEPSNYKSQIESIEKKIKNPTTPTA